MSYGPCIAASCDRVVAASELQLPLVFIMDLPISGLLCVAHLKVALAAKRKAWPACQCGRPKYLDRPGVCEACAHGLGPPAALAEIPEPPAPIAALAPNVERPRERRGMCGGLADRCPNPGTLRAGGRYCSTCLPSGPISASIPA